MAAQAVHFIGMRGYPPRTRCLSQTALKSNVVGRAYGAAIDVQTRNQTGAADPPPLMPITAHTTDTTTSYGANLPEHRGLSYEQDIEYTNKERSNVIWRSVLNITIPMNNIYLAKVYESGYT